MREYKYLIIGGGMTADAALNGIREIDPQGRLGLISSESDPPYDRPPLTKGLWKGKPLDSVWRKSDKRDVDIYLLRTVTGIDVKNKTVADDSGETYSFEKLLLAVGGSPRQLPFGGNDIIYYRNLRDYRRLRDLADHRKRFAVIGGGFIGSELAAALAINHKQVVMLFPGAGICHHLFPADLSQFLNKYYRDKGVELWPGESIIGLERHGEEVVVKTKSRRELVVDGVVAGLGIETNLDLAKQAGLETTDGIVVDEYLRTSNTDIYAAGDVASFYNPALDRRLRVEHEDNANAMGRLAGRNMAGLTELYQHLPFFYSDLFDLGYEAVGELDARLDILVDWKEPYREGVVYYQKQGRVRGVLLWNVWGQVDAARELIASKKTFKPEELKGALPKPG